MPQLTHLLVDSLMKVVLWCHCIQSQQYIYSYPFSGKIRDNTGRFEVDIVCFAVENSRLSEYDGIALD